MLDDDRRYFPPYDAVPSRDERPRRHPGLEEALAGLAGRIHAAGMRRMNHAVDGERRAPRGRPRAWMESLPTVRP